MVEIEPVFLKVNGSEEHMKKEKMRNIFIHS